MAVLTLLFDLLTKEEEDEDTWTGHLRLIFLFWLID